jgi:hypothetical protein
MPTRASEVRELGITGRAVMMHRAQLIAKMQAASSARPSFHLILYNLPARVK